MSLEQYMDLTTRCPLLGGAVPFKYCLKLEGDRTCKAILKCWAKKIPDLESLLAE